MRKTNLQKLSLGGAFLLSGGLSVLMSLGIMGKAYADHSSSTYNACGHSGVKYRNCAEKEAYDSCGNLHQGAIWMSQQQDFSHSQTIEVNTTSTTTTLYLQGSIYTCQTSKSGDKPVYACNITFNGTDESKFPNWSRGDHKNLYRGTSTSSKYTFFEPSSSTNGLAVNVNISSIPPGGTRTFSVGINRIYGWGGCSSAQVSGSYETTTIKVTIKRQNHWVVTPTVVADRDTVQPGQSITWTHRVRSNAGNPPTVLFGYDSSNAGSSNKTAWEVNLGVSGTTTRTSTYTVPLGTAPGTVICRNTVVDPGAYNNSGETASENDCVTVVDAPIPLPSTADCEALPTFANMALNVPATYNPAIKLNNVDPNPNFFWRIYKVGDVPPPFSLPAVLETTGSTPNQRLMGTTTSFTATSAGEYRIDWRALRADNSVLLDCSAAATVAFQPYFIVEGGDILGGFVEDPAFSLIASWNSDGTGGSYTGAGTTHAAIALGNITSFVTSSQNVSSPTRLGFSNTGTSGTKYGGDFVATPTMPDYYGNAAGTDQGDCLPSLPAMSAIMSGVYTCTGDIVIGGGVLAAGKNVTIRTIGNVFIAGNITYGPYNLSNIPRLNVISKGGNVIVSSAVTELHGVFTAQVEAGAGGRFYSCGNPLDSSGFEYDSIDTQCNDNPLAVYGSVVADELVLARTRGSWTDVSPVPAERFIYSPEAWLSRPENYTGMGGRGFFDSYISLPPVL